MADTLRVVFLGSDGIALPVLEALAARPDVTLVGVFTQPDRPVGRGQKVQANAIKLWAQARGLPVLQPEKLTPEVRDQLVEWRADLGLVMAYGHILKDDFITTPRLGMVNLHASLLPAYRGASPIQTAVAEGEERTGVSLMRIVRRLDAGPVADAESVSIGNLDTAVEVEQRLAAACAPLVLRNLAALASGALVFQDQDEARATFCRKLTKDDARIDWRRPARAVAARINGLNPWPGGAFQLGDQLIKVGLADVAGEAGGLIPGTLSGQVAEEVRVAAGDGRWVRLLRLQRPGGKMLPAADFRRGFALPDGVVLESSDLQPLVALEPFRSPKKL